MPRFYTTPLDPAVTFYRVFRSNHAADLALRINTFLAAQIATVSVAGVVLAGSGAGGTWACTIAGSTNAMIPAGNLQASLLRMTFAEIQDTEVQMAALYAAMEGPLNPDPLLFTVGIVDTLIAGAGDGGKWLLALVGLLTPEGG